MKKRSIFLVAFGFLTLFIAGALIYFLLLRKDELSFEDQPEIIMGMKLGGNYHDQLELGKKNGMYVSPGGYYSFLIKRGLSVYDGDWRCDIAPKYSIYNGDSILSKVETYYYSTKNGPFKRAYYVLGGVFYEPLRLDTLTREEIIKKIKFNSIEERQEYYLEKYEVDEIIRSLEKKYGKTRSVDTLEIYSDKNPAIKTTYEENKEKHFFGKEEYKWVKNGLMILAYKNTIRYGWDYGFIDKPKPDLEKYAPDYYTLRVYYTFTNDISSKLRKETQKHQDKKDLMGF